jgi:hypothetical protein
MRITRVCESVKAGRHVALSTCNLHGFADNQIVGIGQLLDHTGTHMRTQPFKLSCAAAFLLTASLSFAQTAAPLTDEQVLKELATIPVPKGQAAPTLADFRSMQVSSDDGKGIRPATIAQFRQAFEWQQVPFQLAQKYYPAILKSTTHDENLTLAFVLKDKSTVLAHATSTAKPVVGESLNASMARLFPKLPMASATGGGSECFAAIPGERNQFCVNYAMLR